MKKYSKEYAERMANKHRQTTGEAFDYYQGFNNPKQNDMKDKDRLAEIGIRSQTHGEKTTGTVCRGKLLYMCADGFHTGSNPVPIPKNIERICQCGQKFMTSSDSEILECMICTQEIIKYVQNMFWGKHESLIHDKKQSE